MTIDTTRSNQPTTNSDNTTDYFLPGKKSKLEDTVSGNTIYNIIIVIGIVIVIIIIIIILILQFLKNRKIRFNKKNNEIVLSTENPEIYNNRLFNNTIYDNITN